MAFFKPKPNLTDRERARIEFHAQQVTENLGPDRVRLPVLSLDSIINHRLADGEALKYLGQHLTHDVSDVRVDIAAKELEQCGGGG